MFACHRPMQPMPVMAVWRCNKNNEPRYPDSAYWRLGGREPRQYSTNILISFSRLPSTNTYIGTVVYSNLIPFDRDVQQNAWVHIGTPISTVNSYRLVDLYYVSIVTNHAYQKNHKHTINKYAPRWIKRAFSFVHETPQANCHCEQSNQQHDTLSLSTTRRLGSNPIMMMCYDVS